MTTSDAALTSKHPLDKILHEDSKQYVVAAGTTEMKTEGHPAGVPCLPTLRWSIDGVNFYPADAYTEAAAPYTAKATCNETNVFLWMENNTGSPLTFYLEYTLDSIV